MANTSTVRTRIAAGALAIALSASLTACGGNPGNQPSVTLTPDDKAFCADLPQDAIMAGQEAKDIADKKHWDYDSDPLFADDIFGKASRELDGFNAQTPALTDRIGGASGAFFDAALAAMGTGEPDPSADEIAKAGTALRAFTDLQDFCKINS